MMAQIDEIYNQFKESNKINLDGKEYDIVQFKSIVDTIKGEYSLKVENTQKSLESLEYVNDIFLSQ
jgi:hypothetical protein